MPGRPQSGRGARAGLRAKSVYSRGQETDPGDDAADREGDGERDPAVALDESADQTTGARETARRREQDRLSRQMARLYFALDPIGRQRVSGRYAARYWLRGETATQQNR